MSAISLRDQSENNVFELTKKVKNAVLKNIAIIISALSGTILSSICFNSIVNSQLPFVATIGISVGINIVSCICGYFVIFHSITAFVHMRGLYSYWNTKNIEILRAIKNL